MTFAWIMKRFAERFIIQAKVINAYSRFGNACAAASLEDIDGAVCVSFRHPSANRASAQPLVLKESEAREVVIPLDLVARVPIEVLRIVEPERASRCRVKVPLNDFAHPRIERVARSFHFRFDVGFYSGFQLFTRNGKYLNAAIGFLSPSLRMSSDIGRE